jgi:hypothetical protein
MTDDPDPTIIRLTEALFDAINEFSERNRLTTGQAMGALFSVLVQSAKGSPQYDPQQLVAEIDARIREAVEP